MKNVNRSIILFGFIISGSMAFAEKVQNNFPWKIVWQDEFEYTGLPDPHKWGYETGHIRNEEKQYYTNARKENVWVENGCLTITGKKEKYTNAFYKPEDENWKYNNSHSQYTSASINTLGLAHWRYGRIEIKAKLPIGRGIWPAIWMLGANKEKVGYPACGEIDIMEYVGKQTKDIHGTVHFTDEQNILHSRGSMIQNDSLNKEFHLYAIEWNRHGIDFYFDDNKYHSFNIDSAGFGKNNPFRKPFFLLINLAMGANWPGPIDDKILPQKFIVDYVRVYKKKKTKLGKILRLFTII
ncbi:MAG TPA: glycoside hydrolase family 16 protein [Chitinophagaceae bacterium]|nr:glycoside hydrolase family 16 protein [Chitinophagaceae bacterium]